jgi:site-specific DNA-methyltransferase (adenine-specific)
MNLSILHGDTLKIMPTLESGSFDLVITSPPYWGLRAYNAGEGELGTEPTMEKYLDNTLVWVKEVFRILKPTGSFVLNIGDCFCGSGGGGTSKSDIDPNNRDDTPRGRFKELKIGLYKPKQLLSVSSFAYCRIVSETEFVCRGEHIWAKPNVPSPIRSRLKHSHEKLFWFVKDADKYYFDEKPWMKPINGQENNQKRMNGSRPLAAADMLKLSPSSCFRPKPRNETSNSGENDQSAIPGKRGCGMDNVETIEHSWRVVPVGAKQSGFELAGKQASEHVAPYPEELIRPYIKSLAPLDGMVLDPFLGSGTTMRVALEEKRNCTGIELSEKSIAYCKKRLNWKQGLGIDYDG